MWNYSVVFFHYYECYQCSINQFNIQAIKKQDNSFVVKLAYYGHSPYRVHICC